jgi:hypothetical protein
LPILLPILGRGHDGGRFQEDDYFVLLTFQQFLVFSLVLLLAYATGAAALHASCASCALWATAYKLLSSCTAAKEDIFCVYAWMDECMYVYVYVCHTQTDGGDGAQPCCSYLI